MARTIGAKNRPKLDDDGMDADNTRVDLQGKPETRGRPKSGTSLKKEILADKLNVMFGCVTSFLGYEYNYTAADYQKEAAALSNISNEHKIVAKVLEFLDPLVMVAGLFDKLRHLKRKPKKTKPETDGQRNNQNNTPQNSQSPSNIFSFKRVNNG